MAVPMPFSMRTAALLLPIYGYTYLYYYAVVQSLFFQRSSADTGPAKPFIGYVYPNKKDFFGIQRSTYNLNDIANISWTSGYPSQALSLQCNSGIQGTGPPWQQVWSYNSTSPTGNGTVLFQVATVNPMPATENTCRFVLDVSADEGDTVGASDAAYSPDLSVDTESANERGTTYLGYNAVLLTQSSAAATTTTTGAISTVATSSAAKTTDATSVSSPGTATSGQGYLASASGTSAASPAPSSSTGLSTSATAAIGVGAALGVLSITSLVAFLLFRRRRQMRNGDRLGTGYGGKGSQSELDPTSVRAEMFDLSPFTELEHKQGDEAASRHGRAVRNLAPGRVFEI